jgi:hypothetical protein
VTAGDKPLCSAYDQISDRRCRYYAGHGGRHNFVRLDRHDSTLERELRRALDAMTTARDEACNELEDTGGEFATARAAELRKVGV